MLTTRTRFKVLSELAGEKKKAGVERETDDEQEERRERRRKKIIDELFETEKTYLHHLDLAHKFFEFPLRFNCLISESEHGKLFSNLEQIKDVNQKLLEHMEQMTVGLAFKSLGPFLKLYSMYANNYGHASSTLQENVQKSAEFARFVQTQENREELMGLKLGALLITPVQRVPRYKLLLEDLLDNTSPEHLDYNDLKEAAKQIGDIAVHINEHVRQHENFQKMLSIQKSFDNSAPNILAPGREFLREGALKKISRRGGRPQERMFFLFSDMILYGKPRLLDSGNNSYSCCCMLPLRHCQVEKVLGSLQRSDGGGMFRILCKDEDLLLHCQDAEEAKAWVETLESSIRKLNINRQTLRKPSSNNMPVRGKSIIRMKKNDLKRKALHNGRKTTDSPKEKKGKFFSPLRLLSSVSEADSPSKRPRSVVSDLETSDSDVFSPTKVYKQYEQNNEINLDEWSPAPGMSSVAEGDENSPATSWMEDDMDVYQASGSTQTNHLEDTGSRRLRSHGNCDHFNLRQSDNSRSDRPWMSPQMETEEKSRCMTWPFRRVSKVTSSIGDVMDSVRHGNRCSVM